MIHSEATADGREFKAETLEGVRYEAAKRALAEIESIEHLQRTYAALGSDTHLHLAGGIPEVFRQWLVGALVIKTEDEILETRKGFYSSARPNAFLGQSREVEAIFSSLLANRLEVIMGFASNLFDRAYLTPRISVKEYPRGSGMGMHRDYDGNANAPSIEVWNILGEVDFLVGRTADPAQATLIRLQEGDRLIVNGADVCGLQSFHGLDVPLEQDTPRVAALVTNHANMTHFGGYMLS